MRTDEMKLNRCRAYQRALSCKKFDLSDECRR